MNAYGPYALIFRDCHRQGWCTA